MSNEHAFLMKPKVDFCFKELMEDEEDKQGILDVRVFVRSQAKGKESTLEQKNQEEIGQLDLEIQLASFPLWPERSAFYLAKMYAGAIQKGQSYDVLPKCIHVGILDFLLFEEDEEYYSRFHLWEDTRRRMYTDKLEIHILELPKLAKREYPQTELLKWANFFRAEKKEEFEMAAEGSSYIGRAYERLTELSADDKKRLEYEAREKAWRDQTYLMNYNLNKGLAEGRKEGRKEGMEEGIKAFVEICQENNFSREIILEKMLEKFTISKEAAKEYLERYWKMK